MLSYSMVVWKCKQWQQQQLAVALRVQPVANIFVQEYPFNAKLTAEQMYCLFLCNLYNRTAQQKSWTIPLEVQTF